MINKNTFDNTLTEKVRAFLLSQDIPIFIAMPQSRLLGRVPFKVGLDELTHSLVAHEGNKLTIVLPYINVDSSQKVSERTRIRDGIYVMRAHYHHFEQYNQYPAFNIERGIDEELSYRTPRDVFYGNSRVGLSNWFGGKTSYINFHHSLIDTDASEGCFTAPIAEFDLFRSMFKTMDMFVLIYGYDVEIWEANQIIERGLNL